MTDTIDWVAHPIETHFFLMALESGSTTRSLAGLGSASSEGDAAELTDDHSLAGSLHSFSLRVFMHREGGSLQCLLLQLTDPIKLGSCLYDPILP